MNKNGKERKTAGKNNQPGQKSKSKPQESSKSTGRRDASGAAPMRKDEDVRSGKHIHGHSDSGGSGSFMHDDEERDERTD
jgi:hypothetical protein